MIEERIRHKGLRQRVCWPHQAAELINDGDVVGISGFTRAGDAKVVLLELVKRSEREGRPIRIDLWTGASVSDQVDGVLAEHGLLRKRLPFQAESRLRNAINQGNVMFVDQHLGHTAEFIRSGAMGQCSVAIIEATAITADGGIVPTTSVGNSVAFARSADTVIVEVNLAQPLGLEGMHDIYDPGVRPNRRPIPIMRAGDRVGDTVIRIPPEKIKAVVLTNKLDDSRPLATPDAETKQISGYLLEFLEHEVKMGRLTRTLAPLQAGIGVLANAVFAGLADSAFENLEVYSEVLQDAMFDLMDLGKLNVASASSITCSPDKLKYVLENLHRYRDKVVLRPQEISNHPEVIRRLGLIGINAALEADIYGNVNSTHVMGTQMMNGIGGSGDFTRNAYLPIFVTKSTTKNDNISCIVPMASHVDHTEHDVQVIVTEQGLADVRNLAPRERARVIIEKCAHPKYRDLLRDYLRDAEARGGQTPHDLTKALSWHQRYLETGTMGDRVEVEAERPVKVKTRG
ncbi:MAG TPA: acetyl-CoA hydrolase/transferase family protein [Symbiobacteriaceae bacterium]